MQADPAPKVDIYMPWYVGDYLTSTALMSTEESGAYSLLLMHMWAQGGSLPLDHDRLAQVARVRDPGRWSAIWKEISVKFMPAPGEPGRIIQRRLVEVLEDARANKVAASDRGKAGAEGRWGARRARQLQLQVAPAAVPPAPVVAPAPPAPAPVAEPMHDASSGQCLSNALQSPPSEEDPDPERAHAPAIPEPGAWPEPKPEPVRFNHGVARPRTQPPPAPSRQMQFSPPQPRPATRPPAKPQPAGSVYAAWVDPAPKWRPKEDWPTREPGQEG